MSKADAYARLEAHLDEHYYAGARDDLREVAEANLITERAYWRDPVQVFAGATWFVVGAFLGVVFS